MKELELSNASYYQTNFVYLSDGTETTLAPIIAERKSIKVFAGIGSRETPPEVCSQILELSRKMAKKGWILRSGGAEGADTAFEQGYEEFPTRKEIFLPWKNFNGNQSPHYKVCDRAKLIAQKFHPNWKAVEKNQASVKLLARDSYQILGCTLNDPCNLVVCWTPNGEEKGGTAQAIRIAKAYGIKVINLAKVKI